jgi:thioredoxin-like negative regulator of GroEL
VVTGIRDEGFDVRTVDVRDHVGLVQKYGIRVVPTFIYVVDGKEVRRSTGAISAAKMKGLFRNPDSFF